MKNLALSTKPNFCEIRCRDDKQMTLKFVNAFNLNTSTEEDKKNVFALDESTLYEKDATLCIFLDTEKQIIAGLYYYEKSLTDHIHALFCHKEHRGKNLSTKLIIETRFALAKKSQRPTSCEVRLNEDGTYNEAAFNAFRNSCFTPDGMPCRHKVLGTSQDIHLASTARKEDQTYLTQPMKALNDSLYFLSFKQNK